MVFNHPKISIIIPVFNGVSTIENAIKSILNQTYDNKELIVVNNFSTDGTSEILEKYKSKIAYLITENDNGIYEAMNKGLKYCSGDFIYFLGSDDELYLNDVLANIFTGTSFSGNDIIYGNAFYIHRKTFRFGHISRYKLAKHNFNHQTVFYPTSVFERFLFDTKYKIWADYFLNLLLFFKTEYRFQYRNITVANFNDRGLSGNNEDRVFLKDKKKIIKNLFPIDVLIYFYLREVFIFVKNLLKASKTHT